MKEKETYTSPECEVLELRLEGVIASSGPQFNKPFDSEEEDW